MTVKIFQIMKLIETIQFYQNNQVANRENVKRDFELQGITKGLEYLTNLPGVVRLINL